jgi:SNF2 family DNA or RNA helicase
MHEMTSKQFELWESQKKCVKSMLKLPHGGILNGETGTGKTPISLYLVNKYIQENKEYLPSLVLCGKTVITRWVREFKETYTQLTHQIVNAELTFEKTSDVYVSTYDGIKHIPKEMKFKYLFIDESHHYGNSNNNSYKNLVEFVNKKGRVECIWGLTATPIRNSPEELQSQYNLIYHVNSTTIGKDISIDDIVKNFVVKLKQEISTSTIDSKEHHKKFLDLSEQERKIYDEISKKETGPRRKGSLDQITILREACVSLSLLDDVKVPKSFESTKIKAILEDISKIKKGDKIVVFSSFKKVVNLLQEKITDKKCFIISGDMSLQRRKTTIESFYGCEEDCVLLVTIKTGSEGIELTCANHVFFVENWWSPVAIIQSIARSDRFGQKKKVHWYTYTMNNTIETKIESIAQKKLQTINDCLDEKKNTKLTYNMGTDDINYLLGKSRDVTIESDLQKIIKSIVIVERTFDNMMR